MDLTWHTFQFGYLTRCYAVQIDKRNCYIDNVRENFFVSKRQLGPPHDKFSGQNCHFSSLKTIPFNFMAHCILFTFSPQEGCEVSAKSKHREWFFIFNPKQILFILQAYCFRVLFWWKWLLLRYFTYLLVLRDNTPFCLLNPLFWRLYCS